MKQLYNSLKFWCMVLLTLSLLPAMAQEGAKDVNVDVNIGKEGGGAVWYTQWWVWAVGLAVFIIIIVAITRGGSNKTAN